MTKAEEPPRASKDNRPLYVHQESLDETRLRLMRLYAGTGNDSLKCDFEVKSINTRLPDYEAISYVWGDLPADCEVQCCGQLLMIRPSLAAALVRFRLPDRSRLIWTDQLCVDQGNLTERSAQVNIMKDIFSKAKTVLIWFGKDEMNLAPDVVRLLELYARSDWWSLESKSRDFPSDDDLSTVRLPPRSSPCWSALNALILNTYWSRVWVIQEACLARAIFTAWGETIIDFEAFRDITIWTYSLGLLNSPLRVIGSKAIEILLRRNAAGKFSLEDWLSVTWSHGASDERDKIFAVLGVSNPTNSTLVPYRADYRKDLAEVRNDSTRYVIEDSRTLETLSWVHHEDSQDLEDACAWAKPRSQMWPKPFLQFGDFTAARKSVPKLEQAKDSNVLTLEGLRLEQIDSCSNAAVATDQDFSNSLKSARVYRTAWSFVSRQTVCHDLHSAIKSFVWTTTAGQAPEGTHGLGEPATNELLLGFAQFMHSDVLSAWQKGLDLDACPRACLQAATLAVETYEQASGVSQRIRPYTKESLEWIHARILRDCPTHPALSTDEISSLLYPLITDGDGHGEDFRDIGLQAMISRRLFLTQKGEMGLGPKLTKSGDIVCVLFGGKTPYVLRPTKTPSQYRFIGECYMMNWMDGQALDLMEEGKLKPEWFALR